MEHLVRKAGCSYEWQKVVKTVKVTRYQSTTCSLSYEEHVELMRIREPSGVGVVATGANGTNDTTSVTGGGGRSKRASLVTVPAA